MFLSFLRLVRPEPALSPEGGRHIVAPFEGSVRQETLRPTLLVSGRRCAPWQRPRHSRRCLPSGTCDRPNTYLEAH